MDEQWPQSPPSEASDFFSGHYNRSVDSKSRVHLPAQFRHIGDEPEDEKYVVSYGPDGSLVVQTREGFRASIERIKQGQPDAKLRSVIRQLNHNSREVQPDSQGRIILPQDLMERAGVTKRTIIVGMGTYFELWDEDSFHEQQASCGEPDTAILDEFYR